MWLTSRISTVSSTPHTCGVRLTLKSQNEFVPSNIAIHKDSMLLGAWTRTQVFGIAHGSNSSQLHTNTCVQAKDERP